MDLLTIALLLLVLLCLLLGSGLWIALSLAGAGYVAMAIVHPSPGLFLASAYWESTGSWTLAALPMFIWMGEILFRTRLSEELFNGLAPWVRRIPAGCCTSTSWPAASSAASRVRAPPPAPPSARSPCRS
jgi:TRAP-type mannitol/chloroaromatic compound transport system permease large subunit